MQNKKEKEEKYEDLIKKLNEIGSIKDILDDMDLINKIISYDGDRHLFKIFIDKINEELEQGKIYNTNLYNFTDSIINLDKTTEKYSKRETYISERLDKINYLTNLHDVDSLAISFTHKAIIDALCNKADYDYLPMELTFFTKAYEFPKNLPVEVHSLILNTLISLDELDAAKDYISRCKGNLKPNKTLNLKK